MFNDDDILTTAQSWTSGTAYRPSRVLKDPSLDISTSRLQDAVTLTLNPPITTPLISTGPPSQVSGVSATESPFKTDDGSVKSNVSVSFTVNPSDTVFDHVQIWFTGYNGNANPQLMPGDAHTSPASFLCDTTGETVTVTVVSVSASGESADFDFSPSTTVTLDGVTSAPPAPSISQSLVATSTGFQFAFNQEGGLLADVIASYNVYHNTVNNSSTATIYQTFPQNPSNAGTVVVQEVQPHGVTMYYWVSAVNTSGLESSKTAAQSGAVTSGSKLDDHGLIIKDGDGFQILTNSEFIGGSLTGYNIYDNNSTGHIAMTTETDNLAPNSSGYRMKLVVSSGGESPGLGGFYLALSPDSGTFTVNTYHKNSIIIWRIGANIPSGYTLEFASNATGTEGTFEWLTSQAGTGDWFEYIAKQVIGKTGSFSSTGFFYLGTLTTTPVTWYVALCSATCATFPDGMSADYHPRLQWLDRLQGTVAVSTILNPQGSVLPGQSVTFTKAAETTSTLGWSWGTQTIKRADSSTATLSSGSQSFTSLTSNTTYYFYPYLTFSGGTATMNFLGPFTSPTAANAINAALDGRTPMGAISDTTTTSGTGGGGTIDPGGDCPHEDELVWIKRADAEPVRMPAKDVRDSDYIKGYSFEQQQDVYRIVPHIRHSPSTMWFRTNGYLVSPCEPVYLNGKWTDAWKVPGAKKVRGLPANRIDIWVGANTYEEHNYYLDNGTDEPLLIHNPVLPRS